MKRVIGMDLGDKHHMCVVHDESGEEVEVRRIGNTMRQVQKYFSRFPGSVVVMEAGTHSPWISRYLRGAGHEVHVGNPRRLRAIWDADDKSDERDARILALMYRLEPRLLYTVRHRSESAQADLAIVKARAQLISARSSLVNHVRSTVKSMGSRITSSSTASFVKHAREQLVDDALESAFASVFAVLDTLNEQIKEQDRQIHEACSRYPETQWLLQVQGVGPVTALAFVLTLEEANRFEKSRTVGAFLGLTPRRDQSGQSDKQLPITKAGNTYLRQLLVNCAHYILGAFAQDSDLRRYGQRIASRGGKNAKKRAVVAVARKLAVLLHRLWQDQAVYHPLYKAAVAA